MTRLRHATSLAVIAIVIAVASPTFSDDVKPAVETWTDKRMPVTQGLVLWLDVSRLAESRRAASRSLIDAGDTVDIWPDGSGHKRDVAQSQAKAQPRYQPTGDFHAIRFDAPGMHLRASNASSPMRDVTVFVVAATYSNPEPYSALLSISEQGKNDFQTGLNIDQAVGTPRQMEVINIEGAGSPGQQNLLKTPVDYGTILRLCVTSTPGTDGTGLWVNGQHQGVRNRADGSLIHMDELFVGARYYTLGGPPEVRGSFDGDIAEVLIYDRLLSDADRTAVDSYLTEKYGAIPSLPVQGMATGGKLLERVKNPSPVQMLVPGFAVQSLPIELPNINNVLYRPDGKLVALGYDGNIWLLSDTDGDGLEDKVAEFWKNEGHIRAPIGMALTPPNYSNGQGVFITSKGKCSLVVDTNGDDKADKEIVIADGWKESPHGVDALGVAVDPSDGSVYFGLGTQDFTNAYGTGPDGVPYDINSERGTIMRIAPDLKSRETIATGIRFPVGLRFNAAGDLFCTDQEGATWLPNGNPLDELIHIQKGRHYGFPPRHPTLLPNVIDEPSTFDYGPQHQSTCGLCFNEAVRKGGPTFGPSAWAGDVFVVGYSRGKLYRTQLAKTLSGYVAQSSLVACLNMLPVDCCLTPDGGLLIPCHSGGPDWGSGPTGKGKLYKLIYKDTGHPLPVFAWPAGIQEVRVEFDRPVDPQLLHDVVNRTEITAGLHVRAGDRFESLWPGYAVVQSQQQSIRREIRVHSAQLTPDRRTLVLATDPLQAAVHYAVTLPGMGRPTTGDDELRGDQNGELAAGDIPQTPQVDLDFTLSGVQVTWSQNGLPLWSGWLPSLDLEASRRWTAGSAHHDLLWKAMQRQGDLSMTMQLDLVDMLRPAIQPGSKLNHEFPPEHVMLEFQSAANIQVQSTGSPAISSRRERGRSITTIAISPRRGEVVALDMRMTNILLPDASSLEPTHIGSEALSVSYTTKEDVRVRPLQPHRIKLPWANVKDSLAETAVAVPPKELDGGSWARGRKVFHSDEIGCAKCHAVPGMGAKIGPDLSNLVHRDYHSVLRDITQPNFAINPDYVASTLVLLDGRMLTGVVRHVEGKSHVGDSTGRISVINPDDIDLMRVSSISAMPESLLKSLSAEQTRDLLTFLLTRGPSMPRDYAGDAKPVPRSVADVERVLLGVPNPPEATRELRVVLVAGPKDHGPGEHDYPAWLKAWSELMSIGDKLSVVTAMNWPERDEFQKADVMVFYQRGDWNEQRAADIDAFLKRGGGLVYVHWAVDGQQDAPGFARRIALAWGNGAKFRHGPLEVDFSSNRAHPVTRGFETLKLVDESYWNLTGNLSMNRLLGTGIEEKQPQPLFWSLEQGQGRIFVSIPGHYSWTFDDPLFRVLLLRGIAWAAHEPVDRFNSLIWPGADYAK